MNVVCDTNVLVSGFLFRGNARTILKLASKDQITGYISIPILRDLEDVLLRPKFHLSRQQVAALLELIQQTFHLVSPTRQVNAVPDDPDDNVIIEAGLAADADRIISGDHHLLHLALFRGLCIVSPAQFLTEWSGVDAVTDD